MRHTARKNDYININDVIMGAIASQITSLTIVYSTNHSDADQRKHQSSASLAFVRGIHRGPVNSPHKWPVTRKMFPFVDVIIIVSPSCGYCDYRVVPHIMNTHDINLQNGDYCVVPHITNKHHINLHSDRGYQAPALNKWSYTKIVATVLRMTFRWRNEK